MVLTNAEKQRAYRQRQKVKELADRLFDGEMWLTVNEFLAQAEFDMDTFKDWLEEGEETEEFKEERDAVWQKAYDEARAAAIETGEFDPDEGDDEFREAANDVVNDWMEGVEDYNGNCLEYQLIDLVAAYRNAHALAL